MDFQAKACRKYAERRGLNVTAIIKEDDTERRWCDRTSKLTSYCVAHREKANVLLACDADSLAEDVAACEELDGLKVISVPKLCEADQIGRFLDAVETYKSSIAITEK
ncbi:MAG: hypothetical protein MEEGG_02489 [Eggerthella lenta]